MKSLVRSACPHDCPDACGVLITVEDGRATKIEGDPGHPVTRGFLCAKVAKYLDRVYSPQRVLYPMKRVEAKGTHLSAQHQGVKVGHQSRSTDGFVRISWDEALDTIGSRLKSIAAEYGPEAVLPYSYGGTLGVLGNGSMDRRFFHRLGASQLDRTICSEAGGEGLKSVVGYKLGTEPEQFAQSRYIIAWGANIHGNNIHLWPFIEEARRKGAKLVVIDPYRTRTAACADWHLAINPGTDVALALGMMHVIIGEKLYDEQYVLQYTFGFEQLRERVREYTPERVAEWTGISPEDIGRLAREYATVRPAVIRANYGLQRCDNGGMAMRAITMLPCLTGSWKEVGGGLQLSTSGAFQFDKEALQRPDLMAHSALGRQARVVNMVELGKALNELSNPPVKALIVYNSNPAAVAPDRNAVVHGLSRPDLFTVVHEQFLTDTCDYADIVLPATTFFEHKELVPAYGHYYLRLSQQAIEPPGECRSNAALFRDLAARMGFEDECFRETDEEMIDTALASRHEFLAGIDRARLESEAQVRLKVVESHPALKGAAPEEGGDGEEKTHLSAQHRGAKVGHQDGAKVGHQPDSRDAFLPFAEGKFGTASGKAEFYSDRLASMGLDPIVSFVPPAESRHAEKRKYPLELLGRKADNFVNSTFANLEGHKALESRLWASTGQRSAERQDEAAADRGGSRGESAGEAMFLEINPADANSRGIRNGDSVSVFNDRGSIRLKALLTDSVRPGVVASRLSWAKLAGDGQNINVLTSDRLTDIGGGPTFYSVLVEVARQ